VHLEHDTLEVEQNINYIFADAVQGRVLVQHAFDRHLGRRNAFHGRQQDAPQALPSV
jgi:hypothetical protein